VALRDFKTVCALAPRDKVASEKMKACKKEVQRQQFEDAIEKEEQKSMGLDIDAMEVEASYDGPHLGTGGEVTMEFVHAMMERFRSEKLIHAKYVAKILVAAKTYFKTCKSCIRVPLPKNDDDSHINVCGDTHGQFYDLCNIWNIGGMPSESNPYLFNGDFVDRGSFSFEVVLTLIATKLACPTGLYMLRGNHETKNMNKIYGFEGEIQHKYNRGIMQLFCDVFQWLPLCAVINDGVFVVHGGLTTDREGRVPLSEIEVIKRGCEPPDAGLMSDLLWADPQPMPGRSPSKRGVGFAFGPDITQNFLEHNGLSLVVRSHEVKDEGYVVEHDGKCITIFSAPNYCDSMGNKGAFIRFGPDNKPHFTQYDAVPHPNVPPMRYAGMMGQFGL
jgi:serine/threonine-protein phosphatase 5